MKQRILLLIVVTLSVIDTAAQVSLPDSTTKDQETAFGMKDNVRIEDEIKTQDELLDSEHLQLDQPRNGLSTYEVISRYNELISSKQYNEAKTLILSNQESAGGDAGFAYRMLLIGWKQYLATSEMDSLVEYKPYFDRYLDLIVNQNPSVDSLHVWNNLVLLSYVYSTIYDSNIVKIYEFATEYNKTHPYPDYNDFESILSDLIFYYYGTDQYQNALDIAWQKHELLKINNDSTVNIAKNLFTISDINDILNYREEALNSLLDSYQLYQSFLDDIDDHETYYRLLELLIKLFLEAGNKEQSLQFTEELCHILEADNNTLSEHYVRALLNKSATSIDSEKMVKFAEDAYHITKYLPNNSSIKQQIAQYLQLIYTSTATPVDQRIILDEHITEPLEGIDMDDKFIKALNDAAQGNLISAKEKLLSIVDYLETSDGIFNDEDLYYCNATALLMRIYAEEGNLHLSDQIFWRAINFYERNGYTCNYLQTLYSAAGYVHYIVNDYSTSFQYYNLAKQIYEYNENTKSLDYAICLNGLALLYMISNDQLNTLFCIYQARHIVDELIQENNKPSLPTQLVILGNIAFIYSLLDEKSTAIDIYYDILMKCNGEAYNVAKGNALYNLANLLIEKGDLAKAKKYFNEITLLPINSKIVRYAKAGLMILKYLENDDSVIDDLVQYNTNTINLITSVFGSFNETERESFWNEESLSLMTFNNLIADLYPNTPAVKQAYDNSLFCKGLLLRSSKLLEEIAQTSGNSDAINLANQIKAYKHLITEKTTPQDSLQLYYSRLMKAEKQIYSTFPDFNERLNTSFAKVQDIEAMLTINDVAIEFTIIPAFTDKNDRKAGAYYAALLARKSLENPQLVILCNADSLMNVFESNGTDNASKINSIYDINDERLYSLIWKELEHVIKPGTTIYYSPSGLINSINLGAIAHNGKRIDEIYELYQVSSTAEIINVKRNESLGLQSVVVYGDVDYGETLKEMEQNAQTYASRGLPQSSIAFRNKSTRSWGPLIYTRDEAKGINNLFQKYNKTTQLLMGGKANEESFKALDGKAPDVIHIATHGFYIEDKNNVPTEYFSNVISLTFKDRAMHYSGLLFAGANNTWLGDTIYPNMEDGILTAQEIGQLDLSNTKLVVLSACQTALGDIDNVNGVLGLQRGFKQAGAGTILMSLWEVQDAETCDFMISFYRILLSGVEKHEAFRQAQKELRARKPDPYYWAAFVLLD